MRKQWLVGSVFAVAAVAGLAFVRAQDAEPPPPDDPVAYPSGQPIAFPHNQHAGSQPGENRMDCQYCHFSAERSVDAGIPPVATCMGCHLVINGRNRPEEVQKIRDYHGRGEPIPWVRIYKVADHVHFPHMRHVKAGMECQECHGPVEEMDVLNGRDPAWGGDNMGWCVDCHRQEGASVDCAVCHY